MADPKPPRQANIFLVDDHPMVRDHLAALIRREPDLTVCGEAEDAPSALAQIEKTPPDLVVMDLSLKESHGLELLKHIKALHPQLPVLVLSMHDESLYAERVLRAGALGYITKQAATVNILTALRKVLRGEVYLSDRMAARLMRRVVGAPAQDSGSPLDILTDRELEVFQMIGRGMGTRRIAEELRLGVKTVETYKARIKEKLRLDDATQLLQHALQWVQNHPG
ncbi:MAG: response regulator transcription factor [Verrucomicrobia bacterium]|nr:response regulator transcription factor [Verrucomicrobiota bacterium]